MICCIKVIIPIACLILSGSNFQSTSLFLTHTEFPNVFLLEDLNHYFCKRRPVHTAIIWRGGKRHLRRGTPLLMSLQKFRRDHPPSTSKIQGGRHPSPPGGEGYPSLGNTSSRWPSTPPKIKGNTADNCYPRS